VKVITVATDEAHQGYQRFLRSCHHFHIPFHNLGRGVEYKGHGTKPILVRRYLRELAEDEIVLFTDSYDAVFVAGLDRISETYSALNHPFVVSAEQNFNIVSHPLLYYWINFYPWLRYPQLPKPYRHLNSGGFIGESKYILDILDTLSMTEESPSDQTFFSHYLMKNPGTIALDYQHRLFTCNGGRCGLESRDYAVIDSRLKNTVTGTYPCVWHIPGSCDIGFSLFSKNLTYIPEPPISDAAKKTYHSKRRKNTLIDKTLKDNFLFNFLCLTGLLVVVIAVYALFSFFN